jgi:peptidoglycan-associated lipoprotein
MKKCLSICFSFLLFLFIGCNKQIFKHNKRVLHNDDAIKNKSLSLDESVSFTDEPSIRMNYKKGAILKTIYFDFDKSDLTIESLRILKENAYFLRNNTNINIVIDGHTDNRGTIEYNLSLGQRRALKVKEYCVQLGISPNRIATISYGKENPIDKNNNESAWAKNRRAEIRELLVK